MLTADGALRPRRAAAADGAVWTRTAARGLRGQERLVDRTIVEGAERMRAEAQPMLEPGRKAMGIFGVWNSIGARAEETQKNGAAR